ncbi:CaiB/BaiF CoA transferase family protein [Sodalis sp. RH21]|uniref:CaiB/BaiF CoA transferase family protein n=1 Tax=unclassified Sodalis (in: enterobacteria) TaxID=2636512 RepID=UPI0039B4D3C6
MMQMLAGITVLDFSQFLSGPSAALRLADLGATVIKVENPAGGDICRRLYISNLDIDGDSSLFHAINRNKQGIAVDLKDDADRQRLLPLLKQADVMIFNFRPGVSARLGLDYDSIKTLNPGVVYGEITGYGDEGPWRDKPGQDLLVQALSGLCHLNGNADQPPLPFGLSIADLFAGEHLAQGILAGLLSRINRGEGSLVQVSLLESILDVQFEVLTTWLNDGQQPPRRSQVNNANAYIAAPYGIYATADGFIAIAMTPIPRLGELLGCPGLLAYTDPEQWSNQRDEIKRLLSDHLLSGTTADWLQRLEAADVWCARVQTWEQLAGSEGFKVLQMLQAVDRPGGGTFLTTRCPIRIDGERFFSSKGAPGIGEDNRLLS